MTNGTVVAICISPAAGGAMQQVESVEALAGAGLKGDRYCTGEGSFNKGQVGRRQVTLINARFFPNSGFDYLETRRNIVTDGVELMWLIGRDFYIGAAKLRGVKYCDPCKRPNKLSGNLKVFQEVFFDCGGLVAEVVEGGLIQVNDQVVPPAKGY